MNADAPVDHDGRSGLERLIVAMDGSALSERALAVALAIGRRTGAEVHLLTVAQYDDVVEPLDERRRYLRDIAARTGVPPDRVHVDFSEDLPPAISNLAVRTAATLVCMGTHGRSGVGVAMIGSITEMVIRSGVEPVVLAGPRCAATADDVFRHLLVPLDGSDCAAAVLPLAGRLSRMLGAQITVASVVEGAGAEADRQEGLLRTYADAVAGELASGSPGTAVDTVVVRAPDAADALVDLAGGLASPALVVMSTHGRTGLARLAAGSVCAKVARSSPAPVVVTRPTGLT